MQSLEYNELVVIGAIRLNTLKLLVGANVRISEMVENDLIKFE